ncbi:MAG: hypothetical protein RXQ94_09410 [Caldivirga sp.]
MPWILILQYWNIKQLVAPSVMAHALRSQVEGDVRLWRIRGHALEES